ncbi:MAG TPA: DUF134 domain-containing protein [Candidatus Omnitrophota bacterium]|nr:DUF134 domain-containing protein [Candidatus Omnitrophota bacterium]HPN56684.1 DUF134 domain-containing protein [Candidatus Omnitrophota bacterium]
MAEVGRPQKVRYIQNMPKTVLFSPRGKPGRPEEVELTLDQFEAIKLADFQGFSQRDGALAMRISRPSFGRILREARAKIADALVNGKIIKITLGKAQVGVRKAEFTQATLKEEIDRFSLRQSKFVNNPEGCVDEGAGCLFKGGLTGRCVEGVKDAGGGIVF